MKEFLKSKKGITLIALVITIVVLIILAGIVISITLGNGGIIDRAKLAKQEYANAQGKEEKDIEEYSNQIDQYSAFTRAGISNINYSTTEQNTGLKWTNGDPIYQITVAPTTEYGSGTHTLEANFITNHNVDKILSIDAVNTSTSNGDTYSLSCTTVDYVGINSGNLLYFKGSTGTTWNVIVTVWYTHKST